MDSVQLQIYNTIEKITKLDAKIYSELLSKYGETVVNQVMEKILDDGGKLASKLEYYVSSILSYDNDAVVQDLFDSYLIDMKNVPKLTREENIELATELHNVVEEINELLKSFDKKLEENNERLKSFDNRISSVWISDRVDCCLDYFKDKDILEKLKKLYGRFIYIRNKLMEGNL